MTGTTHILGAGLSGLAAAVTLSARGCAVVVHEGGTQAGGRCRSYDDAELGCRLDNGTHLMLSGNRAAMAFMRRTGGQAHVKIAAQAAFDFMDLADGARWRLRVNDGPFPLWLFIRHARIPGTHAADYLTDMARLLRAPRTALIAEVLGGSPLYRPLWQPLTVAILNTEPENAAAILLRRVLMETVLRGGRFCRPMLAREGLSPCLIDPALAYLAARSTPVHYGRRAKALRLGATRVEGIEFASGEAIELGPRDNLILALPAMGAAELLPSLRLPDAFRPILNAHFKADWPYARLPLTASGGMIGVLGGISEWIAVKPCLRPDGTADEQSCVISVTVSAAQNHMDQPAATLAATLWDEIVRSLMLPADLALPAYRILKEKRATFAATPEQLAKRPPPRTAWRNMVLAGDWTDTGLPATIEGALRSGVKAAKML
ncbi:MAG: FAD-dependent oxidoreductase [Alphaproteobacteria bacterium]|nr:MAG: FAD-dependent oxidoreductase [Alphaproteobacteria bacterium]